MVKARLCERARPAFFFGSPRHFDFFTSKTKISKCFKCEFETLRRYSSSYVRYKQIGTSQLS